MQAALDVLGDLRDDGVVDEHRQGVRVDGADDGLAGGVDVDADVARQEDADVGHGSDGLPSQRWGAGAEDEVGRHVLAQLFLHLRLDVDLAQDAEAFLGDELAGALHRLVEWLGRRPVQGILHAGANGPRGIHRCGGVGGRGVEGVWTGGAAGRTLTMGFGGCARVCVGAARRMRRKA